MQKVDAGSRQYLYVPFEERQAVGALGAHWDESSKCWYLEPGQDTRPFGRWLGDDPGEDYTIVTDHAYVATTHARCWRCGTRTQVCCLYCEQGIVDGESCEHFAVSEVTSMDSSLAAQLGAWPQFRFSSTRASGRCLTNHCTHCGATQADYFLHCDPGGAFFLIRGAAPGTIHLDRLRGRIRLDGDVGFEPD